MKERIDILVSEIKRHKALYYSGEAEISDAEFDALEAELRSLDPNHEILTEVGTAIKTGHWDKFSHLIPMGSLEKSKNIEEYSGWRSQKRSR